MLPQTISYDSSNIKMPCFMDVTDSFVCESHVITVTIAGYRAVLGLLFKIFF